jgi:NO-binding membrane sensor protein with MHYT domain
VNQSLNHLEAAVGWDYRLVVLSYVIAVFASYTALDLAGRVAASIGRSRAAWLAGGAFAMGVGIWSMHFTGMLALKMGMPVTYDVFDTLLSMAVAIAAATLAFFVVSRGVVGIRELALAGPVMGVGIASMHYIGMAGMRMQAAISYDPLLVAASILIAIGASVAALWLFLRLNRQDLTDRTRTLLKGGSAMVMGAAVVGMHYLHAYRRKGRPFLRPEHLGSRLWHRLLHPVDTRARPDKRVHRPEVLGPGCAVSRERGALREDRSERSRDGLSDGPAPGRLDSSPFRQPGLS